MASEDYFSKVKPRNRPMVKPRNRPMVKPRNRPMLGDMTAQEIQGDLKRFIDEKQQRKEQLERQEERQLQEKTIQDLKDEKLRKEEMNKKLTEENLRQEEQSKKLVDENLRLQDENSNMEERHQRQEETIKKLTVENMRPKQLGKYGFLYYWLHSDCHVSLETPARTYIGIHPPLTKGYHPDKLNVVQSLEEDVKRLGNPVEIIPLVGLNVDEIDEWYKTIDVHYAQWSKDYSLLETALCKGSDDFKNYLAKHKPSIQNQKSPLYIYAAAWDHSHK